MGYGTPTVQFRNSTGDRDVDSVQRAVTRPEQSHDRGPGDQADLDSGWTGIAQNQTVVDKGSLGRGEPRERENRTLADDRRQRRCGPAARRPRDLR